MSLYTCIYCGGPVPLDPDASTRSKDIYTSLLAANGSTADMRKERDVAMSEREELRAEVAILRKENEAMKKRERARWASAASAFGDLDYEGTLRPGDF